MSMSWLTFWIGGAGVQQDHFRDIGRVGGLVDDAYGRRNVDHGHGGGQNQRTCGGSAAAVIHETWKVQSAPVARVPAMNVT